VVVRVLFHHQALLGFCGGDAAVVDAGHDSLEQVVDGHHLAFYRVGESDQERVSHCWVKAGAALGPGAPPLETASGPTNPAACHLCHCRRLEQKD
jgi:hypothetical protein